MNKKKLLIKRIGLVSITNLLLALSEIILLPILTKNIPIADYGIWAQVVVTITLIPGIVLLGLPHTLLRYYPSFKNKYDLQDLFYSSIVLIILFSTSIGILIYYFTTPISTLLFEDNKYVVKLLALLIVTESLNGYLINYFKSSQQIKKHSGLIFLKTLLKISIPAYFAIVYGDINKVILGLLIMSITIFILVLFFAVKQIGVKIPAFNNFKEYLNFGVFRMPINLSNWIISSSDRFMISIFISTVAVGYYVPGYILGNVISMIIFPINFMLPIVLAREYEKNNIQEVNNLFFAAFKYYNIISIPAIFGIISLSQPLLNIMTTPQITEKAYLVTPFVAISIFLHGIFLIMEKTLYLEKNNVKTAKILLIAALINILLNFVLLPIYGYMGAAYSTLISYCIITLLIVKTTNKKITIMRKQNLKLLMKVIFASISMSSIIHMFVPTTIVELLMVVFLGFTFYVAIIVLLRVITIKEFMSMYKS